MEQMGAGSIRDLMGICDITISERQIAAVVKVSPCAIVISTPRQATLHGLRFENRAAYFTSPFQLLELAPDRASRHQGR